MNANRTDVSPSAYPYLKGCEHAWYEPCACQQRAAHQALKEVAARATALYEFVWLATRNGPVSVSELAADLREAALMPRDWCETELAAYLIALHDPTINAKPHGCECHGFVPCPYGDQSSHKEPSNAG